ncbi:hypothetical protein AB0D14_43600 [Streptomyces sp. NPDC048484]|uniref:hypothetical protein n=1 Tax=Streptomyces sp. NPDC048484 TaxID=3155146 RepID=UPI003433063E
MINTSETLAVQTIENFLTIDETAQVTKIVDDQLAATGWVPARPSEGLTPPDAAQEILTAAIDRAGRDGGQQHVRPDAGEQSAPPHAAFTAGP